MKKLVLFLLLVMPVSATFFAGPDFVRGNIAPEQYSQVICEDEKRFGAVSAFKDRLCCVNMNGNKYCDNDEPLLGQCFSNGQEVCLWHGQRDFWYSWRYREAPCVPGERAILAAEEYRGLLEWANCREEDQYFCCFGAFQPPVVVENNGPVEKVTASPVERASTMDETQMTGALLIIDAVEWRALKRGEYREWKPEHRAVEFERRRCANDGGEVRIIDPKYGSFFRDVTNVREGMRAFFVTDERIVPLVTWC